MVWAGLAASIGKGLTGRHIDRKSRRPRRKLTTSEAAIRRAEARRRKRASGPTRRGPSRPTRGRIIRSINTGPRRGRPTRRRKAHCK